MDKLMIITILILLVSNLLLWLAHFKDKFIIGLLIRDMDNHNAFYNELKKHLDELYSVLKDHVKKN